MKQVIDKHPVHPEAYMDKAQKAVEDLKNELIVVPMFLHWWISGSMFALAAKSFILSSMRLFKRRHGLVSFSPSWDNISTAEHA